MLHSRCQYEQRRNFGIVGLGQFPGRTSLLKIMFMTFACAYMLLNVLFHLLQVLTSHFITFNIYNGIRPKKLTNYTRCLKSQHDAYGWRCKDYLHGTVPYFNGEKEIHQYEKLHAPVGKMCNISVKRGSKVYNVPVKRRSTSDSKRYWQCVEKVRKNIHHCVTPLIKVCEETSIRATKLVRFSLESAKYMLVRDPHVRFIYYVRDPRGVLESKFRRRLLEIDYTRNIAQLKEDANVLCLRLASDYAAFNELSSLYPNNFMILRYEDFVNNTNWELSLLYNFIGQEVPSSMFQFFHDTMFGGKEGYSMETMRRNSTVTASMWQRNLHPRIIAMIQSVCAPVMEKLGYELKRLTPRLK